MNTIFYAQNRKGNIPIKGIDQLKIELVFENAGNLQNNVNVTMLGTINSEMYNIANTFRPGRNYYETNQEMKNYMLAEGEMGRMPERGRRSETIKRDTAVVKNYKKALRKKKSLRPKSAFANPAYVAGGLVAAMVLIYGVRSAVQYQGNQKMQEVFQQQEMTDAKNVTGAQQGEEETDTVSKIETTQNSENEVVSDEKAGSSEISEESNSESAVQDTEASETQTTEKTQQTWGSIGGYYTVKRGDTLAGISKKMYQSYNYIEMIAEANGIDNVDEIYPGQILEIPQIED